ncbi:RNA polymerase sigma factor [Pedobacter sp. GR22-6]|uniref:RNA polymerase sigma factor n=1 Tax=Pedobacter sp. GR22-6 TaxID=3127957 RepID=UPI00307D4943
MNAYSGYTDQQLVVLLKQNNETAFRAIFDIWHKKLYHFSLRYLNSREQSEEAVHDALINLWTSREKIEEDQPLGAYLYTICKRLCLNRIREAARYNAASENLWARYQDISHSTEDILNLAELEAFTALGLEKLSKQQQLVFRMSRYEGLSQQEIAERLNISKETVKKHSAEALKTLRVHFEAYGLSCLFFVFMSKM